MAEQFTRNEQVVGSIPTISSKNPVHFGGRDFYFLSLHSYLLPQFYPSALRAPFLFDYHCSLFSVLIFSYLNYYYHIIFRRGCLYGMQSDRHVQ